jgi:hypothetical protein
MIGALPHFFFGQSKRFDTTRQALASDELRVLVTTLFFGIGQGAVVRKTDGEQQQIAAVTGQVARELRKADTFFRRLLDKMQRRRRITISHGVHHREQQFLRYGAQHQTNIGFVTASAKTR